MRIGYQGEDLSYSHQAATELYGDGRHFGYPSFVAAFEALEALEVDHLVLPIENSTTGSVRPVLDRLIRGGFHIVAEHLVEVRHALLGVPGSTLADVKSVRSHPEALAQAEAFLTHHSWEAVPTHDTAGAVRQVAELGDHTQAALAPAGAADAHGLIILATDVVDRQHNTTRFVVLDAGDPEVSAEADKSSVAFATLHQPGALALALTELGLRGAQLTWIEGRPSDEAWTARFFIDLVHAPGPAGLAAIFEPRPATIADLRFLGSYRAVSR